MYNNSQGVVVGYPDDVVDAGAEWAALNGFRLTPQSLSPVPVGNFTDLSEIYWSPYKSSVVSLIDGGIWVPAASAELAYDVTGHTADLPVDLFAFWDGAAVDLEGVDWSDATTRATALVKQDGVEVKSGDPTRRYIGTFHPRAGEGTRVDWVTELDLNGAATPLRLDIWNVVNRVRIGFSMKDTGADFVWSAAGWRQWRADADAQLEVVTGLVEESVSLSVMASVAVEGGTICTTTFGFDSVVGADAFALSTIKSGSNRNSIPGSLVKQVPLGSHFFSWMQFNLGATNSTWFTANAGGPHTGFNGTWIC